MGLPKQRPNGLDSPATTKIIKFMSTANTWLYRRTGGRLGAKWRVGAAFRKPAPICLLTTTGRTSGQPRTVPLVYLSEADRIVLVASQGGLPKNPLWYGNLVKTPEVCVQIGRDTRRMRAHTADDDERARLWPKLTELYADFDNYQSWTERTIPVVVCEPV